MAKFVLDTHALLWFQDKSNLLSSKAVETIVDPDNEIIFSQISLLEIAIKQKIGKLPEVVISPIQIYTQAIEDDFNFLSIENAHIESYKEVFLFPSHRDPFDRLLVAQCFEERATLISSDPKMKLYEDIIGILW